MIWLLNENNNAIYQNIAVATNVTELVNLRKKVQDISRFIYSETRDEYYNDMADVGDMNIISVADRVVEYEKVSRATFGGYCRKVNFYDHPMNKAYDAYNGMHFKENYYELLWLFENFRLRDTKRQLQELDRTKSIIEQLRNSSLDKNTIKIIIEQMWPSFGYFATEFLGCLEFKPIMDSEKYTLEEIGDIKGRIKFCNSRNILIEYSERERYQSILASEIAAKNNSKVLSLARQVQDMVK